MLREMSSVFGKKALIITLTIIFFLFFESVMLSKYIYISESTYILQSTNHEPLSVLYLGEIEGLECT